MTELKATVLTDNLPGKTDSGEVLSGEWGLSFLIEYKGKKVLLDSGTTGLFAKNAEKLGIDLSDIDIAVLSHAHYDHAGGMEEFFGINDHAAFYLREGCACNCYKKPRLFKKYIGIPKGVPEKYKERIIYASGNMMIGEGIRLIPHSTPGLERFGEREKMLRKVNGRWITDDFSHEQSLVFDTEKGLVIFNSCSHGGAANIIKEVKRAFPEKEAAALIGGLHLHNKTEREVRDFAALVKETGIPKIYTGHCTGEKAFGILQEELGDVVKYFKTGKKIVI